MNTPTSSIINDAISNSFFVDQEPEAARLRNLLWEAMKLSAEIEIKRRISARKEVQK